MSIPIPKTAKLVHQTTTQMVYVLREHMWIKTRGDVIFITLRRSNNYKAHIRANNFEVYTNGAPTRK